MKICLLALLSLNGLTAAFPAVSSLNAQPQDDIKLPSDVPAKIKVTDTPADPAGKFVKLRYGPFVLPPNSVFSVLPEAIGGPKIHKPCDECYLGAFQGGLEYGDGSEANVDTGMYMHHFVLVNNNKPDWLCGLRMGSMFRPQYVYNSGNERPPVRLNSKYKFGMRVDKPDTFGTAGELMNMSNETKTVYSTIIYEVIPLDTPGYREATHLRMDVWLCGASDVPAKTGAYTYTSPKYTSPYSGVILHNDGHGHDGTTEVKLHINDKLYCNSIQYYGLRPTTTQPYEIAMHHGDSKTAAMQYISDAVACEDRGRLEIGDTLYTRAYYNGTKYPQMVFKGHRENQMGISFVYIGRDADTLTKPLKLQPLGTEFPLEMNVTLPFGGIMARPGTNTTFKINSTSELTFSNVLSMYGINSTANLSTIFPTIPRDFDPNNPQVLAPFAPFPPPPPMDLSSTIPGMPKGPLNMSDPATIAALEKALKSYVPASALPKNFKLSDVYAPGGVVVSNLEPLIQGIRKSMGLKDPIEELFGSDAAAGNHVEGGHIRVLTRVLRGLTTERNVWEE